MKTNSHKDNDDSATAPEMKQRITYITSSDDELGPSRLSTLKTEAKIQDLRAAKEHRITVDLSELPREVRGYKAMNMQMLRSTDMLLVACGYS